MHDLEQFLFRDLWLLDLSELPFWKRWGLRALRLAMAVGSEFQHRLLDARAAGLVYATLLSLVPFLAVTVSVLKAFGVHHYVEPILAQLVEPLGENGQEITVRIIQFVNNLDVGVLGLVGIAGMFYTTYSLIGKVEESFNAIWQVRQGRSWTRKFTDYLSVVLVGPVLIGSAVGLLASIQNHALVQHVLEIQPFGYVVVWVAQFLPFLILWGVFAFFYRFLPHTQVRADSALVGGTTAALLWGGAGKAFTLFVVSSTKYSAIYSGFAILILFLLWLYVGWLIILVGAQVAFFYQHPGAYNPRFRQLQGNIAWRERAVLQMLAVLGRHYLHGRGVLQPVDLAAETGVPLALVDELVDLLVESGSLSRVATPQGVGFVRPPSSISIADVLAVVRQGGVRDSAGQADGSDLVDSLLHRRDQAVDQALQGVTVEWLATHHGGAHSGGRDPEASEITQSGADRSH